MPWVEFTKDFDFSPSARNGRVTMAYKAGTVANVTRECFQVGQSAGALKVAGKFEVAAAADDLPAAGPAIEAAP